MIGLQQAPADIVFRFQGAFDFRVKNRGRGLWYIVYLEVHVVVFELRSSRERIVASVSIC